MLMIIVSLQKIREQAGGTTPKEENPQMPDTVIPPHKGGSAAKTGSSGLEHGESKYCGDSAG